MFFGLPDPRQYKNAPEPLLLRGVMEIVHASNALPPCFDARPFIPLRAAHPSLSPSRGDRTAGGYASRWGSSPWRLGGQFGRRHPLPRTTPAALSRARRFAYYSASQPLRNVPINRCRDFRNQPR
jgi:hypothetical protein